MIMTNKRQPVYIFVNYPSLSVAHMKERDISFSREKLQNELDALSTFLDSFTESNSLSFDDAISLLREKQEKKTPLLIPSCIFLNGKLGVMESVVKYLREEFRITYHQAAILLKRDDRVVWATYSNAIKKHREKLLFKEPSIWLPLSLFIDPSKGPLESIVVYLRDSVSLSSKQIGELLGRDNRVISTVYNKNKKQRSR
jgi:hypothetical protein